MGTGEYARTRAAVKHFVMGVTGRGWSGKIYSPSVRYLTDEAGLESLYCPVEKIDYARSDLRRNSPASNPTMMENGRNVLLARLSAAERNRLAPFFEPVSLYFGEVLVEFDYPIEYVYFLETAVTSTVVRTPHGETLEVGIMGSEGFVGLSLLYGVQRSNGTVVVQIPGTAMRMKTTDFNQHVKAHGGPCFDLLLRYANFFQVMVQQHAACNASHRIEERMCRWILLTQDRASTDTFALTHEYLSLMLGARRATVTAIAHNLKEAGIISYTRGKLRVSDRERLEGCSCDCYRLIKDQTARTFA